MWGGHLWDYRTDPIRRYKCSLYLRVYKKAQITTWGPTIKDPRDKDVGIPGEAFRACPSGRRPPGRPKTRCRDYVSRLTWEPLGIPLEEFEDIDWEQEFWVPCVDCSPHDLTPDKQMKMDGWMFITTNVSYQHWGKPQLMYKLENSFYWKVLTAFHFPSITYANI